LRNLLLMTLALDDWPEIGLSGELIG